MTLRGDLVADHRQLQRSRVKYDDRFQGTDVDSSIRSMATDLVTHIGFQQLAAFRCASALHRRGITPLAMLASRLIRHLYGAEMHYAATIAPGILIVHGNGLVVSREARVDAGCVLSQHVTLGISSGADRTSGAPHLHHDVHVAPGAVLVGPITVGARSKIAANSVVMDSVPAGVVVAPAAHQVTERAAQPTTAPTTPQTTRTSEEAS